MSSAPIPVPPPDGPALRDRRWLYALLFLAFLFVLMPFWFWQSTWFGRPLSDAEMQKSLLDRDHPRKAQHALSQIADRIIHGDATVKRWYPQVVVLAGDKLDELRVTAAWVMGQDNSIPEFHQALERLLRDPQPLVRRNAALSLVRFGDASGRPEIVAMLRSYVVGAPRAGKLVERLKVGDIVNPGTLLARIQAGEAQTELRSPVAGTIESWVAADGSAVALGDQVVSLSPDADTVWEGLRALYLVGQAEDLPEVELYARGVAGMLERIQQQAVLTVRAIRAR